MNLHKILKIVLAVIGVVGAILLVRVLTTGDKVLEDAYKAGQFDITDPVVNPMAYVAYLILGLAILFVLFFVLKGLFAGNIKKTLISLGVFVGILAVSYFLAKGDNLDLTPFLEKGMDVDESTSKYVGAGLYAFYALAIAAIGTMVFSGIKK